MNANQVNASPGVPAWWASEKSKAEAVTASVLASTAGVCKQPQQAAKNSGIERQAEERLLVDPRPEEPDQGRESASARSGAPPAAGGPGRSERREAEVDQLAQPDQRHGQDQALDRHPQQRRTGENRQSRGVDRLPAEQGRSTRPSGRSQWSVSPSAASPCRIQASAPVRSASAEAAAQPEHAELVGQQDAAATKTRQGNGRRVSRPVRCGALAVAAAGLAPPAVVVAEPRPARREAGRAVGVVGVVVRTSSAIGRAGPKN